MKVLVTSKSFGRYNKAAVDYLLERGFTIVRSSAKNPTPKLLAEEVRGCDALIVGNDPVDRSVLEAADSLKLVHMHGTGLDAIDVKAASDLGVLVANVPGANRNAVAEFTVALMLVAGRQMEKHIELLRQGRWERSAGNEVSGSVVGLIGLGNIGRRVVELLTGFDVRVLAFDPYADGEWAATHRIELAKDADSVFRAADYLVLAAPLTASTERIVNARTLALMKPTAYVVNTARGGLLDEAALRRALDAKLIAGAALDAFSVEPLPLDSPLRGGGVVLTPHLAATSVETSAKVSEIVAKNLASILLEGKLELAVNAEAVSDHPRRSRK